MHALLFGEDQLRFFARSHIGGAFDGQGFAVFGQFPAVFAGHTSFALERFEFARSLQFQKLAVLFPTCFQGQAAGGLSRLAFALGAFNGNDGFFAVEFVGGLRNGHL